jgi:GAF domain-containing protein
MELTAPNPFDRERLTEDVLREWQQLVNLGAKLFGVKAGLITRLAGQEIEILLSSETPGNPYPAGYVSPFPDSGWFCEQTLKRSSLLLIPDAPVDPDWNGNSAVVDLHMVSYMGMPLERPDGGLFGTVCFIDDKRQTGNQDYLDLLSQIRRLIELNLRIIDDRDQIRARDRVLDGLSQIYPICCYCKKVRDDRDNRWMAVEEYVLGLTGNRASHGVCPHCFERAMAEVPTRPDTSRPA